jgi:hypothetical protein
MSEQMQIQIFIIIIFSYVASPFAIYEMLKESKTTKPKTEGLLLYLVSPVLFFILIMIMVLGCACFIIALPFVYLYEVYKEWVK